MPAMLYKIIYLSDDIQFCIHLKFPINSDFEQLLVKIGFAVSTLCSHHPGQSFYQLVYRHITA